MASETMEETYRPWLVLHLLPDVGRQRFNALLEHFGSPGAALEAGPDDLSKVPSIGTMTTESILDWRNLVGDAVERELELLDRHEVRLVTLGDEAYPLNLRSLRCPPPLLYFRGSLEAIDAAAVAVIGSRRISRYGREATEAITRDLARAGITIVSGLALGVDSAAHRHALEEGGRTLAVLGNGLCHVYPSQHAELAEAIVENGALISEMPMAAEPDQGSFPQRNSIIAGLSLGVVVTEAAKKSGTHITAGFAAEENREVFAVPGDITRSNSVGTNQLIKDGAQLITSAQDVLCSLASRLREVLKDFPDPNPADPDQPRALPKDLNPTEQLVMACLELDAQPIDAILGFSAQQGSTQAEVHTALLNLELRNLIRQEPGKIFRRSA